jgi:hypothetical protein
MLQICICIYFETGDILLVTWEADANQGLAQPSSTDTTNLSSIEQQQHHQQQRPMKAILDQLGHTLIKVWVQNAGDTTNREADALAAPVRLAVVRTMCVLCELATVGYVQSISHCLLTLYILTTKKNNYRSWSVSLEDVMKHMCPSFIRLFNGNIDSSQLISSDMTTVACDVHICIILALLLKVRTTLTDEHFTLIENIVSFVIDRLHDASELSESEPESETSASPATSSPPLAADEELMTRISDLVTIIISDFMPKSRLYGAQSITAHSSRMSEATITRVVQAILSFHRSSAQSELLGVCHLKFVDLLLDIINPFGRLCTPLDLELYHDILKALPALAWKLGHKVFLTLQSVFPILASFFHNSYNNF